MKQVFDFPEPIYNLRSEATQFRRGNIKTTLWHPVCQIPRTSGKGHMVPQNIKN